MSKFLDTLNGRALYTASQLVRKTCRFQVMGLDKLQSSYEAGQPSILAAWHGMTMMLVGFFEDKLDISSIVLILPDDWRGEALSIFAQKLGAEPFPMNLKGDSSMAAARQLAKLIRQIKKGRNCYITPDGPDGPAYAIKPGVAYMAQKTGAPIFPLGAYARHSYHLNRWDQYVGPYPYSRISIQVGDPISVTKDDDLTAVADTLTNHLHHVTAQAAANYYEINLEESSNHYGRK